MSLSIRDEKGNTVNELNPITTEHNGTTGDTVTLSMSVENNSSNHLFKSIVIWVNSAFPVDVSLNLPTAPNPITYSPSIEIPRLNERESRVFNLKATVPARTKEQVVKGAMLQVSCLRYPVSI